MLRGSSSARTKRDRQPSVARQRRSELPTFTDSRWNRGDADPRWAAPSIRTGLVFDYGQVKPFRVSLIEMNSDKITLSSFEESQSVQTTRAKRRRSIQHISRSSTIERMAFAQ